NPKINAVIMKHYDEARAQMARGLPDGPFKGVPFLLKDLHLLLEGTITTYGSALYQGYRAGHNSTLTQRYLDAGLVIFGKTNSPEFGLAGTTEPRLYGPTRNPLEPCPFSRRVIGRRGGGCGCGHSSCRQCERWRRLHPHSR